MLAHFFLIFMGEKLVANFYIVTGTARYQFLIKNPIYHTSKIFAFTPIIGEAKLR